MDKDKFNRILLIINLVIIAVILVMFFVNRFYGITLLVIYMIYAIYKTFPSILMLIGKNRYSIINEKAGFEWFKKAYNTKRLSVTNQVFYAYLLLKNENLEESESILEKLTHENLSIMEQASVYLNYSLVMWKKGNNEKSLDYAEYAYKNIKNTVIYGTLGYLKIELCSIEEALKFNQEAFVYNSIDLVISDNYALALINTGDFDTAEKILDHVSKSGAKFPEPYYNLGCLYMKKEIYNEAQNCFEKALTLNFSYLSSLKKDNVLIKLQECISLQEKFLTQ